ncbi:MAG TPA: thiopurine S-methyltransferase [Gammaproteobacteria bacterium]|nr:thiopurine S-methyltransferase [Gammaproteobacteria bacterium]
MDPDFWHARWRNSEIGFHQEEINLHLQNFWAQTGAAAGSTVFVPLCGKSRDLLWLREQGHPVLGVEISPIAVEAFFEENRLAAVQANQGPFTRWEYEGLVILCGDYFDLQPADLTAVGATYDRASLIALPPAMRQRYAEHSIRLLPAATPTLLVTLEYPQQEMDGPPFSVSESEVRTLFAGRRQVTRLFQQSILAENPRFQARGLSRLEEKAYRIQ